MSTLLRLIAPIALLLAACGSTPTYENVQIVSAGGMPEPQFDVWTVEGGNVTKETTKGDDVTSDEYPLADPEAFAKALSGFLAAGDGDQCPDAGRVSVTVTVDGRLREHEVRACGDVLDAVNALIAAVDESA